MLRVLSKDTVSGSKRATEHLQWNLSKTCALHMTCVCILIGPATFVAYNNLMSMLKTCLREFLCHGCMRPHAALCFIPLMLDASLSQSVNYIINELSGVYTASTLRHQAITSNIFIEYERV